MNRTKQTHTPGPWKAEPSAMQDGGAGVLILGDKTGASAVVVAEMPIRLKTFPDGPHATWDKQLANARLIAEAPAMLEALRDLLEESHRMAIPCAKADCLVCPPVVAKLDNARAILARIEGGQQPQQPGCCTYHACGGHLTSCSEEVPETRARRDAGGKKEWGR